MIHFFISASITDYSDLFVVVKDLIAEATCVYGIKVKEKKRKEKKAIIYFFYPNRRTFMENEGPLTTERSKKKPVTAHEVLMEVLSEGSGRGRDPDGGSLMESERSHPLGEGEQEGSVREGEEGQEDKPKLIRADRQTDSGAHL